MNIKLVLFWVLVVCFSGYSEMRIWKDKDGNTYKAEYVRELFDKLTLKTEDGKEVRLPVEAFSEHDQKYLRVMVPPKVEIDFSKKTRIKPKPEELFDNDNDTISIITGTVVITKKSKRPFTSGLTAEIFLIAEELDGDNYIILSKTDVRFLLNDQNENTCTIKLDPVEPCRFFNDNNMLRGEKYAGYLIVISDAKGTVLQTKTDLTGGWIDQPDVIKNLQELAVRGAPSIRSRHFDKTGAKAEVPRPKFAIPKNINH